MTGGCVFETRVEESPGAVRQIAAGLTVAAVCDLVEGGELGAAELEFGDDVNEDPG